MPVDPKSNTEPIETQQAAARAPRGGQVLPKGRTKPAGSSRRAHCRISVAHPDKGLSKQLLHLLRAELPAIDFSLEEFADGQHGDVQDAVIQAVDVVWLCGYEGGRPGARQSEGLVSEVQGAAGDASHIEQLRTLYPHATLLVTRSGELDGWDVEAREAGADFALAWPVPAPRLLRILEGASRGDALGA